MLEGLFYDLLVLYEGDKPHPALAFCTGERVYLIDLLYQSGPILFVLVDQNSPSVLTCP